MVNAMPDSGTGVNSMISGSGKMTHIIQADVLNLAASSSNLAARNNSVTPDSGDHGFMNMLAGHISEMNTPREQENSVSLRDIREAEPREDISLREKPAAVERDSDNAEIAGEGADVADGEESRTVEARDPEDPVEREALKPDEHDSDVAANAVESNEKSETAAELTDESTVHADELNAALQGGAPGKTSELVPDLTEPGRQVDRLLAALREVTGDSEAHRDLKEGLLKLKEFIRDGEEPQRVEALLRNLKTKIEAVMREAAGEGRDMSRFLQALGEKTPDLRKEFSRLSEMMSRYAEHVARPGGERAVEGEQKPAFAVTGERSGGFVESLRPVGNESAQGNSDSNIGFNQFRQGQQFTRTGAAPDGMARMQNFNDQLQSMLDNSRLVVKDGKNGHFTMQLFPESMGRVNVRLGLEDGIINGRFLVDSNEARDQMLENLGALRQKMADAGIAVGEFQVNVRQQQEQFAGKNEEEENDVTGAGTPMDSRQQYELGAMIYHDGSFDMTA